VFDVIVGHGQAVAREVQRLAGVIQHRVVGIGQREDAALQIVRLDGGNHQRAARSAAVRHADQHLALRAPAQHRHGAVFKRDALGQAAGQRHHIGFLRAS
jgi:hypothetical protein